MGHLAAPVIGALVSTAGAAVVANQSKPDLKPPTPPPPPPTPGEDAVTAKAVRRTTPSPSRNQGFDVFEIPTNNILPS